MDQLSEKIKKTIDYLDSKSPSFCLAKWLQVTIHLHNGFTHSCHHPTSHAISLRDLEIDPSVLHNTRVKMRARQDMRKGIQTKECDYCWRIENLPQKELSDRVMKSSAEWAMNYRSRVDEPLADEKINPSYVEVTFSNACNFKCAYCSPDISTTWHQEIAQHGPYPTHDKYNQLEFLYSAGRMPKFTDENENPYTKAFWKWWPQLKNDLMHLRITGGEPLLSPSLFKTLDSLIAEPLPHLTLAVNSNLGIPEKILQNFVQKILTIQKDKKIKNLQIFTSLDTWGEDAEFIRTGLDLARFQSNLNYLLEQVPDLTLTFMCTYNVLSIPRFSEFIKYILDLKKRVYESGRGQSLSVDISYVRHPHFLSPEILPQDMAAEIDQSYQLMLENTSEQWPWGFSTFETVKLKRIAEMVRAQAADPQKVSQSRRNFISFIQEYEKRRSLNFLKTFPTMKPFWDLCQR